MTRDLEPSERNDLIAATIHNFRSGEIGTIRFRAGLSALGLRHLEIDNLIREHIEAHTAALKVKVPKRDEFKSGLPE